MRGTRDRDPRRMRTLPLDISKGPHQDGQAPFARMSRPGQRMPPTRSVERKGENKGDWELGIGSWGLRSVCMDMSCFRAGCVHVVQTHTTRIPHA